MRLTCPECAAEYDVPDAALGTARRLRCSACGTSWELSAPAAAPQADAAQGAQVMQAPPQRPAQEPAPAEAIAMPVEAPRIEMAPERRMPPTLPPPQPRHRAMLAWTASLAIVIAALAALYVWRVPVMQAWPPAARLYTALGLA